LQWSPLSQEFLDDITPTATFMIGEITLGLACEDAYKEFVVKVKAANFHHAFPITKFAQPTSHRAHDSPKHIKMTRAKGKGPQGSKVHTNPTTTPNNTQGLR
jgi:hypothetical protein